MDLLSKMKKISLYSLVLSIAASGPANGYVWAPEIGCTDFSIADGDGELDTISLNSIDIRNNIVMISNLLQSKIHATAKSHIPIGRVGNIENLRVSVALFCSIFSAIDNSDLNYCSKPTEYSRYFANVIEERDLFDSDKVVLLMRHLWASTLHVTMRSDTENEEKMKIIEETQEFINFIDRLEFDIYTRKHLWERLRVRLFYVNYLLWLADRGDNESFTQAKLMVSELEVTLQQLLAFPYYNGKFPKSDRLTLLVDSGNQMLAQNGQYLIDVIKLSSTNSKLDGEFLDKFRKNIEYYESPEPSSSCYRTYAYIGHTTLARYYSRIQRNPHQNKRLILKSLKNALALTSQEGQPRLRSELEQAIKLGTYKATYSAY